LIGISAICASSVTIDARIREVQHTGMNFFNSATVNATIVTQVAKAKNPAREGGVLNNP